MKRESGYTIMEVGLALAISGSMLFMAASLYGMSTRQHFNDSINATKTFLERQYNDVRFGINNRISGSKISARLRECRSDMDDTDVTAGNSKCYIVGRLVEFQKDKMVVSYIVATPDRSKPEGRMWDNPDGIKDSAANIIYTASKNNWLKVLPANDSELDAGSRSLTRSYGGDNILVGAWNAVRNGNPEPINDNVAVAILHNPIGGAIMTYSNVVIDAASGDEVRTLRFKGDTATRLKDSIDTLNNIVGVVLYVNKGKLMKTLGSYNDKYSVAYCIPTQGTSSGIKSSAPAPFRFDLKNTADKDNLIGVCDEAAKPKR